MPFNFIDGECGHMYGSRSRAHVSTGKGAHFAEQPRCGAHPSRKSSRKSSRYIPESGDFSAASPLGSFGLVCDFAPFDSSELIFPTSDFMRRSMSDYVENARWAEEVLAMNEQYVNAGNFKRALDNLNRVLESLSEMECGGTASDSLGGYPIMAAHWAVWHADAAYGEFEPDTMRSLIETIESSEME